MLIRHEQVGGHAAEGYAHATGRVGADEDLDDEATGKVQQAVNPAVTSKGQRLQATRSIDPCREFALEFGFALVVELVERLERADVESRHSRLGALRDVRQYR